MIRQRKPIRRRLTPQPKAPWFRALAEKEAKTAKPRPPWVRKPHRTPFIRPSLASVASEAPKTPKHPIRQVSQRQARLNAEYYPKARAFKIANPVCQCCPLRHITPPHPTEDVHHKRGRGRYLLEESTYAAVCRECHTFIDANRTWAYSVGLLILRSTPDAPTTSD